MAVRGRKSMPPEKDGDTHDAFSQWRRLLCVFDKPGVIRKTRRRFHKLVRREAKREIRDQASDS